MSAKALRITVLGGGPGGLSLCHYLRQALGDSVELTLVEKSERVGGWLHSERRDGFLFERGPHSFRPSTPAGRVVLELVDALGLRDAAIAPPKSAGKRFLWLDGKLQEVAPTWRTPIGRTLLKGALRDLVTPRREVPDDAPRTAEEFRELEAMLASARTPRVRSAIRALLASGDESVADFVGRRFGTDVAEQAADAMISGIFAGDARRLSARSCFPLLPELERDYRSVVWAMLRRSVLKFGGGGGGGAKPKPKPVEQTAKQSADGKREAWLDEMAATSQVSFREGMETLGHGLAESFAAGGARSRLLTGRVAVSLDSLDSLDGELGGSNGNGDGGAVDVRIAAVDGGAEEETIRADYVFSTLPSIALAELLPERGAAGAGVAAVRRSLSEAPTVSVGVVNLGYDEGGLLPHEGVGHLIPSREWEAALGVIWSSSVFPQQAENERGETRLTVMVGGAHAHQAEALALHSETELIEHAQSIVSKHLGVTREPSAAIGGVLRDCLPQYTLGHKSRLDELEAALAQHCPRLKAIGNSLYGVGIADTIATARRTAEAFAAEQQHRDGSGVEKIETEV
jgi:oxygen-dependent protoporphyrinogen oxidase